MIFGTTILGSLHVIVSLIGISSGCIAVAGLLGGRRFERWTAIFLVTTVATSVTGFGFPFVRFMPSHAVGIVSLVVLAVAIYARYTRHMAGGWRRTYIIGAVLAFYLNVFVLVVQIFAKLPFLEAMAPTQSEPPFLVAQSIVLTIFVALGVVAVTKFHPDIASADRARS